MPFAREYGGLLANRSFGGAQVSRTFYARGQTGQQLLLKQLMLKACHGERQAMDDRNVLLACVGQAGLDLNEAENVLNEGRYV